MDYKDTPALKKLIREWRSSNCRGEGGRAAAIQMEQAIRAGYEQCLLDLKVVKDV